MAFRPALPTFSSIKSGQDTRGTPGHSLVLAILTRPSPINLGISKSLFAEIDGLMAGINYMDKRCDSSPPQSKDPSVREEPGSALPQSPFGPHPPQAEDTCYPDIILDEKSAEGVHHAPSTNIHRRYHSTLPPGVASLATQWTALRKLRTETEHHHQRFLQITKTTTDPILKQLRTTYPTAKKVRKQGMLLMRQILDDYQPHKFDEIFAFTSLSYAMAKRLHAQGKLDGDSILADFSVCCNAISDDASRASFVALASVLWPESLAHSSGAGPPQKQSKPFERDAQYSPRGNDQLSESHDPSPLDGQFLPIDGGDGNRYSAPIHAGIFGPDLGVPETDLSRVVCSNLQLSHQVWNYAAGAPFFWESMILGQHPTANIPSTSAEMDMGLGDDFESFVHDLVPPESWGPSATSGVAPGGSDAAFLPQKALAPGLELRLSKVFTVVLCFCQEVKFLVDIFSGLSFTSKHESTKMYPTQRESIETFYDSANRNFFEPLRATNKPAHQHFTALLSVVETLTGLGYFGSLAEIRHYMRTVGLMVSNTRQRDFILAFR
jgi:hypothetical protein